MSRGEVFWLEQSIADVPATDEWLSAVEQQRMRSFRIPKRTSDWRLGRWTAKRALAQAQRLPDRHAVFASIEIVAADSGAPRALVSGEPAGWHISISHSGGRGACAVTRASIAVGCDLERIEMRSDAFVADYFTAAEQEVIAGSAASDRAMLQTLFWSAKESAMKTVREGLRLDTRSMVVARVGCPSPWQSWAPLTVRVCGGAVFQGYWRADDEFVRTIVADPACSVPKQES